MRSARLLDCGTASHGGVWSDHEFDCCRPQLYPAVHLLSISADWTLFIKLRLSFVVCLVYVVFELADEAVAFVAIVKLSLDFDLGRDFQGILGVAQVLALLDRDSIPRHRAFGLDMRDLKPSLSIITRFNIEHVLHRKLHGGLFVGPADLCESDKLLIKAHRVVGIAEETVFFDQVL